MRFQLLSAFQALSMPEGAYPVTHDDARRVIASITGACIPEGMTVPSGLSVDECMAWLRAAVEADPAAFGW